MKEPVITWKEGEGWSRDELRWTDKDTAFVREILDQNNESHPLDLEALIRDHESRP